MYCKKCGKVIPENSIYCMFCGVYVKKNVSDNSDYPQTDIEKLYEDVMVNRIIPNLKSPTTAQYPKYNEEMQKELNRSFSSSVKVIETYIDSMNSFGSIVRTGIRIRLNKEQQYDGVAFKENTSAFFSLYKYL